MGCAEQGSNFRSCRSRSRRRRGPDPDGRPLRWRNLSDFPSGNGTSRVTDHPAEIHDQCDSTDIGFLPVVGAATTAETWKEVKIDSDFNLFASVAGIADGLEEAEDLLPRHGISFRRNRSVSREKSLRLSSSKSR